MTVRGRAAMAVETASGSVATARKRAATGSSIDRVLAPDLYEYVKKALNLCMSFGRLQSGICRPWILHQINLIVLVFPNHL